MCNYFGSACAGPREEDLKRYAEQVQREYDALMANESYNHSNPYNFVSGIAATPDPMSRPQPGIEADPKYIRIRQGWLTQAQIDGIPGPAPVPTPEPWLHSAPGIILTLAVFLSALGAAYLIYSLWGMGEIYRAITAAGKG